MQLKKDINLTDTLNMSSDLSTTIKIDSNKETPLEPNKNQLRIGSIDELTASKQYLVDNHYLTSGYR